MSITLKKTKEKTPMDIGMQGGREGGRKGGVGKFKQCNFIFPFNTKEDGRRGREKQKGHLTQKTKSTEAGVNPTPSVITLRVWARSETLMVKHHRLDKRFNHTCAVYKRQFRFKGTNRFKRMNFLKNDGNTNPKKVGIDVLT